MNETQTAGQDVGGMDRQEMMTALFAHMVIQQSNLAMMLLGKVPHPQTGQPVRDLEAAKLFIDQLEMLGTKTKGNLTKDEEQLLKQNLMALRMAFVEATNSPAPGDQKPVANEPKLETPPAADEESKKKFTKKY